MEVRSLCSSGPPSSGTVRGSCSFNRKSLKMYVHKADILNNCAKSQTNHSYFFLLFQVSVTGHVYFDTICYVTVLEVIIKVCNTDFSW